MRVVFKLLENLIPQNIICWTVVKINMFFKSSSSNNMWVFALKEVVDSYRINVNRPYVFYEHITLQAYSISYDDLKHNAQWMFHQMFHFILLTAHLVRYPPGR